MPRTLGQPDFSHEPEARLGVLLVNLGTPAAPEPKAVRRYLAEFLSDPRVIELPRILWWPILHGIILRTRPRRSAKLYKKIWTGEGSPLLAISRRLATALQTAISRDCPGPVNVALGMRYGEPSLAAALEALRAAQVRRLLVLPLYPQYSATTSGSTFDAVTAALRRWRWLPELRFVLSYHDEPDYIAALVENVRAHWAIHGRPEKLLFSFHGIPRRYFDAGDPYHRQCHKTARLVAEQLGLQESEWLVCFQSRFGPREWLKPYTDHVLRDLTRAGTKYVQIVCPGFAADCLETLEEVNLKYRDLFIQSGGGNFSYIPALNDQPSHVEALAGLVYKHTQGWPETARRKTVISDQ
jgi:ferrochelatase